MDQAPFKLSVYPRKLFHPDDPPKMLLVNMTLILILKEFSRGLDFSTNLFLFVFTQFHEYTIYKYTNYTNAKMLMLVKMTLILTLEEFSRGLDYNTTLVCLFVCTNINK